MVSGLRVEGLQGLRIAVLSAGIKCSVFPLWALCRLQSSRWWGGVCCTLSRNQDHVELACVKHARMPRVCDSLASASTYSENR